MSISKANAMLDMMNPENVYAWTSVAAAASDNAKKTSAAIDRLGYSSCMLLIPWQAVLAEAKTVSFTVDVTDCATSGGSYASYSAVAKTVYGTGGSGGSTASGMIELDVDLKGADRYLKVEITSDLSATGTDTAYWGAALVLADPDSVPV